MNLLHKIIFKLHNIFTAAGSCNHQATAMLAAHPCPEHAIAAVVCWFLIIPAGLKALSKKLGF